MATLYTEGQHTLAKRKSKRSSPKTQARISQQRKDWNKLERLGLVKRREKTRGWKPTKYQVKRIRELRAVLDGDKKPLPLGPKALAKARKAGEKVIAGRYVIAPVTENKKQFLERVETKLSTSDDPHKDAYVTVASIILHNHTPPEGKDVNLNTIRRNIRAISKEAAQHLAKADREYNFDQLENHWLAYPKHADYEDASPIWYH